LIAEQASHDDAAYGAKIELGIQPINAAIPTAQNKVNAMPAIQIMAWGNLPDCISILLTCVSMRTTFKFNPCQTKPPSMP
jgi:hypothetical protein